MFWRADPRDGYTDSTFKNWPRDGATFKGIVHEVKGQKWLECKEIKQSGGKWTQTEKGAWMPFKHAQYYLEKVE